MIKFFTRSIRACLHALMIGQVMIAGIAIAESPHNNYMIHCQGCHLADGSGSPPDVPSFAGQLSDFLRVEGGRAYLVQVPGTANAPIDDQSIAELLNWILVEFGDGALPENFAKYSAQEVAGYRSQRLADPGAMRESLLAALSGS